MKHLVRYLRRVALRAGGDSAGDAELLEAFLTTRDEAAFETLLRRHGPMVLGVCRRALRNPHDADDAFQATFLVLVRKAATIRPREMVGNWLYGVACRTARKARAMNIRRRMKESRAPSALRSEEPPDTVPEEILQRLDAEVSRLPDKYRLPVVLCELQGKSRKEAARLLGLAEGTLSWRLAWARKTLARRLSCFGVPLSAAALTTALAEASASAGVPPALLSATARAALQVAAGRMLSAGAVSAEVITLTEGVLKAMLLSKLKIIWGVALAVTLGAGATGLVYQASAADPAQGRAAQPALHRAFDELEELRLEVQALRKGLEATRERVKSLETEVETLRRQRAFSGMMGGNTGGMSGLGAVGNLGGALGYSGGGFAGGGLGGGGGFAGGGLDGGGGFGARVPRGRGPQSNADKASRLTKRGQASKPSPADPLGDAEKALKELRQHPDDRQAAEQLERAVQSLKLRSKPKEEPAK